MRKVIPFLAIWLLLCIACNFPVSMVPQPKLAPNGLTLATLEAVTKQPETQASPPTITTDNLSETPVATPTENTLVIGSATLDPETYAAQSGDTLDALAKHFGIRPNQITSVEPLSSTGLIPTGMILSIPDGAGSAPYTTKVLPDSEVINSPSASNFNLNDTIEQANGFLNHYSQAIGAEHLTGVQIVQRVVDQTSINPRLLLAILEFRSHWLTQANPASLNLSTPMGYNIPEYQGLFLELSLTAKLLDMGYYGWRDGSLTQLVFSDGQSVRLAPRLNAGSVALQYFFARLYPSSLWKEQIYGQDGFSSRYIALFGDPWVRAAEVEPLFPTGLIPPALDLPFAAGEVWAFTGGPHEDWNTGTPGGALDFAPITGEAHCQVSAAWARAAAPGTVVVSAPGEVLLALDGQDGKPSGWELFYFHMAQKDRAPVGVHLTTGEPIGHPSCEGGNTTGVNLHIARIYNGEWIGAGDPLPFILGGWNALPGARPYEGTLVMGNQVITADPNASKRSRISW